MKLGITHGLAFLSAVALAGLLWWVSVAWFALPVPQATSIAALVVLLAAAPLKWLFDELARSR